MPTEEIGATATAGAGLYIGCGVFGTLLGVGLVMAGLKGRRILFAVWGGMLSMASVAYVLAMGWGPA